MSFKPIRILQLISFILFASNVYSQSFTEESMQSTVLGGLGWGVIACIISLIIGVLICIFGLSTVMPGVFIAIGFCIPLFIFIFFSFCPMEDSINENLNPVNNDWNVFIIWRWLYFSVMLAMLFALFAPLWILWNVTIMPQRVDSRAQKKHDEEFQAFMKEEKKKEVERELLEQQQQQQMGSVLDLNQNNNLNMNNNNNKEGYLQQPIQQHSSILPASKNENNLNKFATLKRKTHHQDNNIPQ